MNQLRFIRQTVYALKREYGVPMDIYAITSTTTDLETGVRSQEKTVYRVKRAILLPKRLVTDVARLLASGRPLHSGANTDVADRVAILDSRDYPASYSPQPEDYSVISGVRYNVVSVEDYDHRLAVVFNLRAVAGELSRQLIDATASSNLGLGQEGAGET